MKRTKITDGTVAIDLLPMVDMVFLIFTFLMLALYFEDIKADERIKLPNNVLARPPEFPGARELVLQIGFDRNASGQPRRAEPVIHLGETPVSLAQIQQELEREQRAFQSRHRNASVDNVSVLIRAEAEVPTGLVQQVVQICQDVGYARFSLKSLGTTVNHGKEPAR